MFEEAVKFVLDQEGGLSDDPNDPGGLTKFGISSRAFPNLDIRNLTQADAVVIYREEYWDRCQCDRLPGPIAILLFDAAVNQGVAEAARMLQAALGVDVDGVIGTKTISAANTQPLNGLVSEFVARRMFHYGTNPQFPLNGLGWSRRLAQVHQLTWQAQLGSERESAVHQADGPRFRVRRTN